LKLRKLQSDPGASSEETVKSFYRRYHDAIQDKRLDSPYPLRRYVHRTLMDSTLESVRRFVKPGARILDAGCGEGALAMAMAIRFESARVTGVDLSTPNINQALRRSREAGLDTLVRLAVADLENLPFPDDSFDIVVSSHVIEHLPKYRQGLEELRRVTRDIVVLGLPTCLNPSAMVILGGDDYWTLSRRSPFAFWLGLGRILLNLGREGVDEGYVGRKSLPHLWRYPWVLERQVADAGFEVIDFEAPSIPVPYLPGLVPGCMSLQRALDRFRRAPLLRYLGYGSIVTARKQIDPAKERMRS
jgi:SAM-dependent methyltransferase